jgi:hypothetical protein
VRSVTFAAVLAVAVALLACGGDGDDASDGEPPGSFTREDSTYLVNLLTEEAQEHGWVAGCIWQSDIEAEEALYVADVLGLARDDFEAGTSEELEGGRRVGTVYRRGYAGEPVSSFEKVETEAYLCYRPGTVGG